MATLGDEGGLVTWAMYNRWPFFAVIFAIVGLCVGFFFGSIIGAAGGLFGGMLLGSFGGMLMGKNKAMFPVIVEKLVAYSGGAISFEGKYPARVVTITFRDDQGGFVEPRRVEYLEGTRLRRLPPFSLPTWFKEGDTRRLQLLQLDTYTFRPVVWKQGTMIVENVPVYVKDADGRVALDEQGKPIVAREESQAVFDTNVEFDNNRLVPISRGVAAKLDNERASYAEAVRTAYAFNRAGDFWQKYGQLLFNVLCIAAILIVCVFSLIKFQEAASSFALSTSAAVEKAANANSQTAYYNAQVAAALLKSGFNLNATFCETGEQKPTPPPVSEPPGKSINLPFIGRIA